MKQAGSPLPNPEGSEPATLAFPVPEMKPTEFFRLNVPPSNEDTHIRVEYFKPRDAHKAVARNGQQLYLAPDGSAFLIKITTHPASASTTFGVRTFR